MTAAQEPRGGEVLCGPCSRGMHDCDCRPSESSASVGGEAVSIVPPYCTGASLSFEPGVLHVSKDGSGYIAISEEHFSLEDDRGEGPDGPEGSVHWITRLDASEIVALRDFLMGAALSTQAPAREGESWASMAKWTEETFGPVSLERIATRANEEMQELLDDPSDVMEAADVCIVLSRYPGIEEAINSKMAINRKREWRLNGDGSGYHVKSPAALHQEGEGRE